MQKLQLSLFLIFLFNLTSGQNYIYQEKSLLISNLMAVGFDTTQESKYSLIDSSTFVLVRFNTGYSSRIEYHLTKDSDNMEYCDSIYSTSTCLPCLKTTLSSFLNDKSKKWKKESDRIFYSLKNQGKQIYYGPPKETKYYVYKLSVIYDSETNPTEFSIHEVLISEAERKRLKKIKTIANTK